MIYLVEEEPQFVAAREMAIYLGGETPYYVDEGEPLGLSKTEDGRLFLGTIDSDGDGDVIEFGNRTVIGDLLESCHPATFHPSLDEDGDGYMKAVLVEGKSTLTEKISRITLTENIPEKTIQVEKIRFE